MTRQTIDEMLARARARLERVSPGAARAAMEDGAFLIDVRRAEQVADDGRVPGAVEISLNVLEWRLDPESRVCLADGPGLDDPVIVLCDEGFSSSLAASRLQDLGFARATDVEGGFQAWRAAGLPVEKVGTD